MTNGTTCCTTPEEAAQCDDIAHRMGVFFLDDLTGEQLAGVIGKALNEIDMAQNIIAAATYKLTKKGVIL